MLEFLLGTVTFEVSGSIESFLNEIRRRDLRLRDVHKTAEGKLNAAVFTVAFKKIRDAAEHTRVNITVIGKNGLPFFLYRYRKRYGLFAGALIFAAVIFISSLFVWDIKVTGCKQLSEYDIISRLNENGLYRGMLKNKISVGDIENKCLTGFDEVSWMAINIKGTVAYVEIREIAPTPEITDTSEPCSIYASRDGVIASVEAYMGYSAVKVGDTVSAGDLLVSGDYTDKYGVQYKLHSYARVMAYTVHSHSVSVPYEHTEHIRTGKTDSKYALKLIRFVIPLYFNEKIIYNNYDTTHSESVLRLTDSFALPISLLKTSYTEVEEHTVIKSRETAINDAYEKIRDYEYNLTGLVITDKKYECTEDETGVTLKAVYECYEDIGIPQKIS